MAQTSVTGSRRCNLCSEHGGFPVQQFCKFSRLLIYGVFSVRVSVNNWVAEFWAMMRESLSHSYMGTLCDVMEHNSIR